MAREIMGKGLGALLPASPTENGSDEEYFLCHIDRIVPNPEQPRREIDPERLQQLAESIREKGVLQPLVVTPLDGTTYQIVAGERRWRAARLAEVHEVPVVVRQVTDEADRLELALIENIQRQDLNPMEEARCYRRLLEEFGLTQDQVARKVGKDRSTVANSLRLLQLPDPMAEDVAAGVITAGHARALLQLQELPAAQAELHCQIKDKGLSVRQAEALAKRLKSGGESGTVARPKAAPALPASYCRELVATLEQRLGVKSRIVQQGERGKLEIQYTSVDDLERLMALIRAERGNA